MPCTMHRGKVTQMGRIKMFGELTVHKMGISVPKKPLYANMTFAQIGVANAQRFNIAVCIKFNLAFCILPNFKSCGTFNADAADEHLCLQNLGMASFYNFSGTSWLRNTLRSTTGVDYTSNVSST